MKRSLLGLASTAAGILAVLALHSTRSPSIGRTASRGTGSGIVTTTNPTPATTSPSGSTPTAVPRKTVNGSATGSAYQYGFGALAVKVTMSGGKISDLRVVGLQTAEPYSQTIAQQAIPILRNEVLSAQSATVQAVSGATYTSQAYLLSTQSALDKLRA
jgi:uncharacterized protein with FMN-binding domain